MEVPRMNAHTPRRPLAALAAALGALLLVAALALALLPAGAGAAGDRTPIRDCGDVSTLDDGGAYVGAVTAQGPSCRTARGIAKAVAGSARCKRNGSCRSRGFTCLLGVAGKELTLARCEDSRQEAFVRFEFGA
jgi:hypothetical protein